MNPDAPDPEEKAPIGVTLRNWTPTTLLVGMLALGATAATPTRDHWSFLPPRTQTIPTPHNAQWVRNPVDAFILDRLEHSGLQSNPEASRRDSIAGSISTWSGCPHLQKR